MTRPRLPRLTIRARLTLVYGGLFLLAGVLLLGTTYVLVSQQVPPVTQTFVNGRTGAVGVAANDAPSQFVVGQAANATRHDALTALLTRGGIALLVVGAAATAFGWLIAGRMLRPLHRVIETTRRIAEAPAADRGLHERIPSDGADDEIRDLTETFNVMLERLDHSFDGQRRFIANASHELRTPLTLNRTLLEVALAEPGTPPETRQLGGTLMAINARNERLIDGLLLLARAEGQMVERAYVDLADIVEHVAEQVPPGTVAVGIVTAEAPTAGNAVLLERLVQNLVDNGIRYNVADGGWVRVQTGTTPEGSAVLEVSNTGPVVPRYQIPSLFEPFRRLAADRLGSGLGLSIVRAVAQAHGGDVRAAARDGGGLVVRVTLPQMERAAGGVARSAG